MRRGFSSVSALRDSALQTTVANSAQQRHCPIPPPCSNLLFFQHMIFQCSRLKYGIPRSRNRRKPLPMAFCVHTGCRLGRANTHSQLHLQRSPGTRAPVPRSVSKEMHPLAVFLDDRVSQIQKCRSDAILLRRLRLVIGRFSFVPATREAFTDRARSYGRRKGHPGVQV